MTLAPSSGIDLKVKGQGLAFNWQSVYWRNCYCILIRLWHSLLMYLLGLVKNHSKKVKNDIILKNRQIDGKLTAQFIVVLILHCRNS